MKRICAGKLQEKRNRMPKTKSNLILYNMDKAHSVSLSFVLSLSPLSFFPGFWGPPYTIFYVAAAQSSLLFTA